MNKIQKILKFIKSESGFAVILLTFIIILFVILSPKVSSLLFPFKRKAILNDFINKAKTEKTISAQSYWMLREFYSPGYFTFSRNGIDRKLSENAKKRIGIQYYDKDIVSSFLFFSSPRLNSLDMLTRQTSLDNLLDKSQFKKANIIFEDRNCIIYQENPQAIKMLFLFKNSEMKTANGFFDYQDKDKNITYGENWLNVTSLKID